MTGSPQPHNYIYGGWQWWVPACPPACLRHGLAFLPLSSRLFGGYEHYGEKGRVTACLVWCDGYQGSLSNASLSLSLSFSLSLSLSLSLSVLWLYVVILWYPFHVLLFLLEIYIYIYIYIYIFFFNLFIYKYYNTLVENSLVLLDALT